MPAQSGDIIQFDLRGNYGNLVETHNVFHYEVTAVNGTRTTFEWLSDAALSWANLVLDDVMAITNFTMSYNQIKAKLIFGADAGVQNTALLDTEVFVGTDEGQSLPPHDVWTYRKQGAGGTQRNGYQHFSGIPELQTANGQPAAGMTTLLNAVATLLASNITVWLNGDDEEANEGGMKPVIVKRVANGENPDDIDVLAKWYPVGVAFAKIGTVNSRKFGVGV